MHRRYITFISLLVVAMFSIMPLSQLSSPSIAIDSNSPNKINPSLSNGLLGEVVNSWHVSGKTCAPSSASIESAITLKIDVTSFSESSGAGDTALYFIVSGVNVHTVYIGGTGVYTYTWDVNSMPGNINFHAEYLSGSEFYSMHSMAPEPSVFFHNSYSTFGNSNIHVEKYMNEVGYDGNNTIYPIKYNSNGLPSYTYVTGDLSSSYNYSKSNANMDNYLSLHAVVMNRANDISVTIIASGIGKGEIFKDKVPSRNPNSSQYACYYYGPYYQNLSFNINDGGSKSAIDTQFNSGINVTGTAALKQVSASNASIYKKAAVDALTSSLGHYLGVLVNTGSLISYWGTSGILSYNLNEVNSGTVFENYRVKMQQTTMVPNKEGYESYSDIERVSFGTTCYGKSGYMTLSAQNMLKCDAPPSNPSCALHTHSGAKASLRLNVEPASEIYGFINETGKTGPDTNINNTYVYIKDMNSGDFYKVPIKNGHYLFFAKPNTKYEFYSYENNNFKLLRITNGNIAYSSDTKEITTPAPGNSINVNMDASDFT